MLYAKRSAAAKEQLAITETGFASASAEVADAHVAEVAAAWAEAETVAGAEAKAGDEPPAT